MSAPVPVTVTAMSERPDGEQGHDRALVVEAGPAILGVAAPAGQGWTAGVRAGLFRRRVVYRAFATPDAAVAAILRSPVARAFHVDCRLAVRWSDTAARACLDAWTTA